MRNISCMLARWGVWVRLHPHSEYATPPAGMRRAQVVATSPAACSDEDAALISGIVGRLKSAEPEKQAELIIRHYVHGQSKCAIARKWKCSESRIRQSLLVAESFVAGSLSALGVTFSTDINRPEN